jgi:hypothetical protein
MHDMYRCVDTQTKDERNISVATQLNTDLPSPANGNDTRHQNALLV